MAQPMFHLVVVLALCVSGARHPPAYRAPGGLAAPAPFAPGDFPPASSAVVVSPVDVEAAVRPVLEALAEYWNSSFSFGFTNSEGTARLAAGLNDVWSIPKRPMTVDTSIPMGSITKSWTAVAIVQYVEKGVLGLDDLASQWVDPVLQRLNGSSFAALFPGTEKVTIEDLLAMRSGLDDIDDMALFSQTLNHGGQDISPFDILHLAEGRLVCVPQQCVSYSSLNYELLGLALVQLQGVASWEHVEQFAVVSSAARAAGRYNHTLFPLKGRCSDDPRIAHQYSSILYPYSGPPRETIIFDLVDFSCLNGWTCGNIASTGGDLASYFYDLLHGQGGPFQLVNASTLKRMVQLKPMANTWCPGCMYGLGLMSGQPRFAYAAGSPPDSDMRTDIIGHGGADWGSSAVLCGDNRYYHFGICLASNSDQGLNMSHHGGSNDLLMALDVSCRVYDAVLALHGGPRLNCSVMPVLPDPAPIPASVEWRRQPRLPVPTPAPAPKPVLPPVSGPCLEAYQKIVSQPLARAAGTKVSGYDAQELLMLTLTAACHAGLLGAGSCDTTLPWNLFASDLGLWKRFAAQARPSVRLCSTDASIHSATLPGYPPRPGGYQLSWRLYSYFPLDSAACSVSDGRLALDVLAKRLCASFPGNCSGNLTWTAGQGHPCTAASDEVLLV